MPPLRAILQQRLDDQMSPIGNLFSNAPWDIMLELGASEQEKQPSTISAALICAHVAPASGHRHLVNLCSAGLVVRRPHESDKRVTYLELTAAGRELLEQHYSKLKGLL